MSDDLMYRAVSVYSLEEGNAAATREEQYLWDPMVLAVQHLTLIFTGSNCVSNASAGDYCSVQELHNKELSTVSG